MPANEQMRYVAYAFNSIYVNRKQNTHIHSAKIKQTSQRSTTVSVSDIENFLPKYWNIGQQKFHANRLTLLQIYYLHCILIKSEPQK